MKTEKSTLSVLFLLKKSKAKRNGLIPIHGRITVDGQATQFNTKLEINEVHWGSGRAAGKSAESNRINFILDDIRSRIHSLYHRLRQQESYVTAEKVKNAFFGRDEKEKTLLNFFELHNADFKQRVQNKLSTHKSYTRYELTKMRIAEYLKKKYKVSDMAVSEMNTQFVKNFYLYLRENTHCNHNSVMKFIQRLHTVILYAKDAGLITTDPLAGYKLKFEAVDRGYLVEEEIEAIMQKEFPTARLEQVRDIFIFSCYTGLSYIDVAGLRAEHIRTGHDGKLWIMDKREKTGVSFNIPLLDIPKMILDKYKGKLPEGKLLPVLSNQKMNAYLKEIADLCGIDKPISYHLSRHSFATLALTKGVSIESISKMLGHSNIKTTQIYARITNDKIGRDMAAFAEKLEQQEQEKIIVREEKQTERLKPAESIKENHMPSGNETIVAKPRAQRIDRQYACLTLAEKMYLFNLPSSLGKEPEREKRVDALWEGLAEEEKKDLWSEAFESEARLTLAPKAGSQKLAVNS